MDMGKEKLDLSIGAESVHYLGLLGKPMAKRVRKRIRKLSDINRVVLICKADNFYNRKFGYEFGLQTVLVFSRESVIQNSTTIISSKPVQTYKKVLLVKKEGANSLF